MCIEVIKYSQLDGVLAFHQITEIFGVNEGEIGLRTANLESLN